MQKRFNIWDKDGTITDLSHRRHYVNGGSRQWGKFFEETINDTIIWPIANLMIDSINRGDRCEIWSAACETTREMSVKVLEPITQFIDWDNLDYKDRGMGQFLTHMRGEGDNTPDYILKEKWLLAEDVMPDIVYDDRLSVVQKCWRKNGVTCAQVAPFFDMNIESVNSNFSPPRKASLNLLIGPSGAGKSTYLNRHLIEFDMDNKVRPEVYSSDLTRARQFPSNERWCNEDAYEFNGFKSTFSTVHRKIKASLEGGEDVIYDATNIKPKNRKDLIKFIDGQDGKYDITYTIIDRPLDEKLKSYNNIDRFRTREEIIEKQHQSFKSSRKHAMKGDGFSFIKVIEI